MTLRRKVQDQKVTIESKPTWHHFGRKINWFEPQINKLKKTKKEELMI
jgi:hypothetical protein